MRGWDYGAGWGCGSGWGWGTWLGMAVMMAVVWGVVILAIVLVFRSADRRGTGAARSHREPAQILAERYARGEIDELEYRSRTDVLQSTTERTRRRHPSDAHGA